MSDQLSEKFTADECEVHDAAGNLVGEKKDEKE